jgi:uroporphyrinogen-III synthase
MATESEYVATETCKSFVTDHTSVTPVTIGVMSFAGARVLSFESRRAAEMAELIRKQGGNVFVAPSMREVALEESASAFSFAEQLFAGGFDMIVLLTGIGTRQLARTLAARYPQDRVVEALKRVALVARGPKPTAALREMGLQPALIAPEPNTWREVLAITAGRPDRRIAIQEYGRPNPDLIAGFEARGATVTSVRVYQWDLPEDTSPLREAAQRLARQEFDVVLFTTAIQISHLMRVAEELGMGPGVLAGLNTAIVASIGPTTSETLDEFGVHVKLEPSHPKMGFLVRETAEFVATHH